MALQKTLSVPLTLVATSRATTAAMLIKAWMASGLDAMPTPYQGNAMDEVRRAAEAANRVDLFHVPGGQVAGMLSEERNNVPAKRNRRPHG